MTNRQGIRYSFFIVCSGVLLLAFSNCTMTSPDHCTIDCGIPAGSGSNNLPSTTQPNPSPTPGPAPAPQPNPNPNPNPAPSPSPSNNQAYTTGYMALDFANHQGTQEENGNVSNIDNGDWISHNNITVESGTTHMWVRVALPDESAGGRMDVRIGSRTGQVVGSITFQGTGGWDIYDDQSLTFNAPVGTHNLFFVFSGGFGIANFQKFVLVKQ